MALCVLCVSIHARLATGDAKRREVLAQFFGFNSRPSCDGRLAALMSPDAIEVSIHARLATGDTLHREKLLQNEFQFTPVLRRATRTNHG